MVLVSSSDETEMTDIARQAQADAFIAKQHMHETLVPTLKRLLATATAGSRALGRRTAVCARATRHAGSFARHRSQL